ncbi:MAG TPA: ABC transporter ATP-binding protein [Phototrophicaceae bacterium]|nr:ABC transporter ATP-binding protein [Phototrophicaceae bacterium]
MAKVKQNDLEKRSGAVVGAAQPNPLKLQSEADLRQDKFSDRYLILMLGQFVKPYWRELLLVFVMLAAVTALSLLPPYLIQRAVDGPINTGDLNGLIPYGVVYFVSVLVLFVLRFGHTYLLQTVGQNALVAMRQTLFEHIIKQDMRFFNTTPVGQLVSRFSNDVDALTELVSTSIVVVASNLVTLVGLIGVMFLLNWRLALLGLCLMPIMIVLTVYFRRKIRGLSSAFHKLVGEYLAFINEQFNGMLIVQLFNRQELSRAEFDAINQEYKNIHSNLRDVYTVYASVLQLLTSAGLAIVLYGGGQGVLAGWATLGMLISFIEYTRRSFEPILQLTEQFAQIQQALSAGERIAKMLKVEPHIVDPEQPQTIPEFRGTITLEQVHFSYEPEMPVLRAVDLHIPAGQRVAIVGATGAGKTSLAGLLSRFYDVDAGHVRIDGVDVRDLKLADLRHYVTVVPQNPYCFNGTVADNLRLFDNDVTDAQMIAAAQTARAAAFIERLPDSYNYELLPGGANLSQGQRQLLALTRALIHSPGSILVLDEATSSIDTETEALIQEGLAQVLANRTSLIIAHRLSTVRDADRILVMQQGRVVEDGTHEQLLAQNGLYAQLYRRQFEELHTHHDQALVTEGQQQRVS